MTVRKRVPEPLKKAGRTFSVRFGTATSGSRMLPGFILAGAQRTGTTSLFRALMAHPLVLSANFHKGVNYFDINYHRGMAWYRGHFPVRRVAEARTRRTQGSPMTFDASGYYMFHPLAAERMGADLPDVKVITMVRDPIVRAHSAHKHELARGFETEPFERAIELEDERLAGEVERMCADPRYYSVSHRHHAYLRRGQYAEQLQRLLRWFPREQLLVVESENFFERPQVEFERILDFLDLPLAMPPSFDRYNARPRAPMTDETRDRLEEHFKPHDEALAELLGHEPAWVR